METALLLGVEESEKILRSALLSVTGGRTSTTGDPLLLSMKSSLKYFEGLLTKSGLLRLWTDDSSFVSRL